MIEKQKHSKQLIIRLNLQEMHYLLLLTIFLEDVTVYHEAVVFWSGDSS